MGKFDKLNDWNELEFHELSELGEFYEFDNELDEFDDELDELNRTAQTEILNIQKIKKMDGATCIGSNYGHKVALIALVTSLATRWRHLHCHIAYRPIDCPIDIISWY